MSLKTLPMIGPRTIKAAITTIATKTRISAYSTRPWPFSLGENNILKFLLSFGFHRKASSDCPYFTSPVKIRKCVNGIFPNSYVSLSRKIIIDLLQKSFLPQRSQRKEEGFRGFLKYSVCLLPCGLWLLMQVVK